MPAEKVALWILGAIALLAVARGFIRGLRGEGSRFSEVWPLEARPVLTEREQAFYQRLVSACPDYVILSQVALSQLIRVRYGTRKWRSVFARYRQLVADFVICRKDFSAVAVVELDDFSHAREDRMDADRRKTKAVESAGLRLIRIPAGQLPSQADLQSLLGFEVTTSASPALAPESLSAVFGPSRTGLPKPLLTTALLLGAVVVGGAWWAASHPRSPPAKTANPVPAPQGQHKLARAPKPVALASAPVELADLQAAEQKRREAQQALATQQAADDLETRKQAAWAQYYKAPASCEHPPAWQDQVECGNQYIRAKREFEKEWAAQNTPAVGQ